MIIESLMKKLEDTGNGFSSRQVSVVPDVIANKDNTTKRVIIPEKFKTDVEALERYAQVSFTDSSLESGICITVTLAELLEICPRERKRSDAYGTLIRFLKDELNVTLTIKKNRNYYESKKSIL